jgi:hypothetical protein
MAAKELLGGSEASGVWSVPVVHVFLTTADNSG